MLNNNNKIDGAFLAPPRFQPAFHAREIWGINTIIRNFRIYTIPKFAVVD